MTEGAVDGVFTRSDFGGGSRTGSENTGSGSGCGAGSGGGEGGGASAASSARSLAASRSRQDRPGPRNFLSAGVSDWRLGGRDCFAGVDGAEGSSLGSGSFSAICYLG